MFGGHQILGICSNEKNEVLSCRGEKTEHTIGFRFSLTRQMPPWRHQTCRWVSCRWNKVLTEEWASVIVYCPDFDEVCTGVWGIVTTIAWYHYISSQTWNSWAACLLVISGVLADRVSAQTTSKHGIRDRPWYTHCTAVRIWRWYARQRSWSAFHPILHEWNECDIGAVAYAVQDVIEYIFREKAHVKQNSHNFGWLHTERCDKTGYKLSKTTQKYTSTPVTHKGTRSVSFN